MLKVSFGEDAVLLFKHHTGIDDACCVGSLRDESHLVVSEILRIVS